MRSFRENRRERRRLSHLRWIAAQTAQSVRRWGVHGNRFPGWQDRVKPTPPWTGGRATAIRFLETGSIYAPYLPLHISRSIP